MAKKKKYEYKLTRAGRKDIKSRARQESELYARPKKKRKARSSKGSFNPKKNRYNVPTTGLGTHLDQEKKYTKPKKVLFKYTKHEPKDKVKGGTKVTDKFQFKASTQKEYDEKLKAAKEAKETREKVTGGAPDRWQGYKDMAENEKLKKEGEIKGEYEKKSRTKDTLVKKRDLERKLKNYKLDEQQKRGKITPRGTKVARKKMYRDRKKYYKDLYKSTGYMS